MTAEALTSVESGRKVSCCSDTIELGNSPPNIYSLFWPARNPRFLVSACVDACELNGFMHSLSMERLDVILPFYKKTTKLLNERSFGAIKLINGLI